MPFLVVIITYYMYALSLFWPVFSAKRDTLNGINDHDVLLRNNWPQFTSFRAFRQSSELEWSFLFDYTYVTIACQNKLEKEID